MHAAFRDKNGMFWRRFAPLYGTGAMMA